MPIEFACEVCARVLRVPDGSSGKRSRCPSCQHEQEIPWVASTGQQAVASTKLSIPCPKCQHHLVCSQELLGKRGQCKKCQHIFTISTAPTPTEPAAPALVFHCPKCQQLFEGSEKMRGRKGKCHVCQAVFMIELQPAQPKSPGSSTSSKPKPSSTSSQPVLPTALPTPAASSSTSEEEFQIVEDPEPQPRAATPAVTNLNTSTSNNTTSHDEEELLIIDEPEPKPKSRTAAPTISRSSSTPNASTVARNVAADVPIRFECTQCRGVMEVPGSTAGLDTECPYCQTVQTIPDASTVAQLTHTAYEPASVQQPAYDPLGTAYDPLGGMDFTNPYAAPTQAWSAPAATGAYSAGSSKQVSVGNVLQLGFDSMFPSCLMFFLHMLIFTFAAGITYLMVFAGAYALRGTGEASIYFGIAAMVVLLLVIGLLSAWFAGATSRMALDAVRKKPFNMGDAMNPSGAFNAAILVMGGGALLVFFMYLPVILHMATGALKGMEVLMVGWIVLFIPIMMLYGFGTSVALFAGADGESSTDAIKISFGIIFKNFGTALGVMIVSGMISGIAAVFTFGVSYVLPIYMTAALYHLAKK